MLKKTDDNQKLIVKTFKKLGFSVFDLSAVGKGFPDLIVAKNNQNYLIEVKTPKGKLNQKQVDFIDYWQADVYIIRSPNEVINFLNKIKKQK